jgi:hypothetical protein
MVKGIKDVDNVVISEANNQPKNGKKEGLTDKYDNRKVINNLST